MNFFKKLFGTRLMSEEELAALQNKKEQKKRIAEEQKQRDLAIQEKYIGTGFGKGFSFALYKPAIQYFETYIIQPQEKVLLSVMSEYDKTKNREIKGLLIATDVRLVFVTNGIGHGQYFEEFDYKKIKGISHVPDGFGQREILIDYGRSRKAFDDIIYDDRFHKLVGVIQNMMHSSRNNSNINRTTLTKATKNTVVDRYTELEKIAELKAKGILTEEEFEAEKKKILSKEE